MNVSPLQKTIAGMLVGAFLFVGIVAPKPVHAGGLTGIIHDPINWIQHSLSNIHLNLLTTKEFALDALAWSLVNMILEQMINDITAWIQSGFEGQPAFLENPGRFFRDVGDIAAGQVLNQLTDIDGDGTGWLCRPIDFQVRFLLYLYAYDNDYQRKYSCRLSQITDNVEDFYNNSIRSGGIIALQTAYHRNPYAQLFELQIQIDQARQDAEQKAKDELEQGRGFLSFRECLEVGDTSATDGLGVFEDEHWPNCTGPVRTPGAAIQTTLENALNIQPNRLTIADEINEAIGALLQQLLNKVVGGVGGLLGGGSGGGSGGGGGIPQPPTQGGIPPDPITLFATRATTALSTIDDYADVAKSVQRIANSASQVATQAVTKCGGNQTLAVQATELNAQAVQMNDQMATIIENLDLQRTEIQTIYTQAEVAGDSISAEAFQELSNRLGAIEKSLSEVQTSLIRNADDYAADMGDVQIQALALLQQCS
jgi:hypothetical protein